MTASKSANFATVHAVARSLFHLENAPVRYELEIDGGVLKATFPDVLAQVALSLSERDVVRMLAPGESFTRDGEWRIRRPEAT